MDTTKKILVIAMMLVMAIPGFAEDIFWLGTGSDNLWSTDDNWDTGYSPMIFDIFEDTGWVKTAPDANSFPVIDSGVSAEAAFLLVFRGDPNDALMPKVTMNGGSLTLSNALYLTVGSKPRGTFLPGKGGMFELNDGAFELQTLIVCEDSNGTFNMNGGTLDIQYESRVVNGNCAGNGVFNLNGGTLTQTNNFYVNQSGTAGSSGVLNIDGGTLDMTGAFSWRLFIASATDGEAILNIDSGSILMNRRIFHGYAGNGHGVLNMTGGNIDVFGIWFGCSGNNGGTLNISGGSINCSYDIDLTGGTGEKILNLTGGTISTSSFAVDANKTPQSNFVGDKHGYVNIAGGTLIIRDVNFTDSILVTESILEDASNGLIDAYEGDSSAELHVEYDGQNIIVYATNSFDIFDLAQFVTYWLRDDCDEGNNFCEGFDFEPTDGCVDFVDFAEFARYW